MKGQIKALVLCGVFRYNLGSTHFKNIILENLFVVNIIYYYYTTIRAERIVRNNMSYLSYLFVYMLF